MKVFKIILRYLLLVSVCVVIFWFSSHNGTDSTSQSTKIVNLICKIFFPDISSLDVQRRLAITDMLTVLVRKGAHFFVYTMLGALSFCAFFQIKKYGLRFFISIVFTFLYACTDEIHQMYVPNRTARISDVFIDTFGGVIGAFIVLLLITFVYAWTIVANEQKRKKVEQRKNA